MSSTPQDPAPGAGGTLVFWHPHCSEHDTGSGHPERAARMQAVLDALGAPEFRGLQWREAPAASFEQLERVHPAHHVDRLMSRMPAWGQAMLDGDTIVSPGSFEAALRAAGAVCAAVDAVVAGEAANAFCAIRPPGHHAEPARAMGFCLFNNVAVGAEHARRVHGIERVAIVDFDVHHGNGTQAIFEAVPQVLYVSTHQYPLYPGTGHAEETGVAANVLNVPLRAGSGGEALRRAWNEEILPALRRHEPGLLLVSAGFDAHRDDPLAELAFTEADYQWLGAQLAAFAAECCGGRLVSVLEGGYDLSALASSCAAHVRALMAASG
ncbi:histone deacetylase family protein [Plasticicumulans sp.]|uniref:histone deacetylase family protein n=1 Tax=Plasticicumulans sp. TaxID=2307179 RepID=UPI00394A8E3E